MPNPKDISDPITAMNMALVLIAKAFKLNHSTPTNNNQRILSNQRNRQIAQPDMNMEQDRHIQMIGGYGGNQNAVQNSRVQNVGNQNEIIVVSGIAPSITNQNANHYGNGNVIVARAKGNANGNNAEEYDLMAATRDIDEIEEVNENCILMANLQQALTSGTQIDKAPIYDSDGSSKVLEPISEPHQTQQNNNNVTSVDSSVEQSGGTAQQHLATVEETRTHYESLFKNLAVEVEKVNMVNRKLKVTNVDLTTELARYKGQEKSFEVNKAKFDELEIGYIKSVYQEQCLTKKINALHLKEKKRLKSDLKIHEDELLDKQIDLEKNIKELDNILAKSREEVYFLNTSQMASVSKSFSIPNDEYSDDTARVARKFLNEVKDTLVTLQHTSDLQIELDRTKDKLEYCIIKKEKEHAILWNDWYKKCEECIYDKLSYDKAYNDMQNQIERLQAHLGDLKGKSSNTRCVSNTLDPLSQKLKDENVSLEFLFLNYDKENKHLKTIYKNQFDSIKVTRAQTKIIIDSLQQKLNDMIYENASLRAQLHTKFSEQKLISKGTSVNTKFKKQSILGKPPSSSQLKLYSVTPLPKFSVIPKVGETNALSNKVTSNSAPSYRESTIMKNDKLIAPGMYRINPSKTSRVDNDMLIKPRASVRTTPITASQSHVTSQENVNPNLNVLSSTGIECTAKTRRPHHKSNTKNYRVPLRLQNAKSEVICVMCKQCLITANHDVCVPNFVNDMNSRGKKQKANVSNVANQMKQKPKVRTPNKVGSKETLALPKPSEPSICRGWSPIERIFDYNGKIIKSSVSKCQSDNSIGTVRFGNDHVAAILGYGDLQWGNIFIARVYFVEGLGHNLFSIGQFCDSDLEVAFRRNTCFVRNLDGVDLLKRSRTTNLYTINLHEMASASCDK
ncbi:hypothetical protein Tco_1011593 [Tanacetum coccineum]